jgi:hypothetical protein
MPFKTERQLDCRSSCQVLYLHPPLIDIVQKDRQDTSGNAEAEETLSEFERLRMVWNLFAAVLLEHGVMGIFNGLLWLQLPKERL